MCVVDLHYTATFNFQSVLHTFQTLDGERRAFQMAHPVHIDRDIILAIILDVTAQQNYYFIHLDAKRDSYNTHIVRFCTRAVSRSVLSLWRVCIDRIICITV